MVGHFREKLWRFGGCFGTKHRRNLLVKKFVRILVNLGTTSGNPGEMDGNLQNMEGNRGMPGKSNPPPPPLNCWNKHNQILTPPSPRPLRAEAPPARWKSGGFFNPSYANMWNMVGDHQHKISKIIFPSIMDFEQNLHPNKNPQLPKISQKWISLQPCTQPNVGKLHKKKNWGLVYRRWFLRKENKLHPNTDTLIQQLRSKPCLFFQQKHEFFLKKRQKTILLALIRHCRN